MLQSTVTFADLCEPFADDELPWLDRSDGPDGLTDRQRQWRELGYVVVPGLIPDSLIQPYVEAWHRENEGRLGGWPDAIPYMRVPELRALATYAPVADVLQELIGEPMGVHLNLTGMVSTQRDWHQDGYLNPETNRDWYAAAWMALDDVDPESGPFEFVPGSHRQVPNIRQDRTLRALGEPPGGRDAAWPERSERILTPLFEGFLTDTGMRPERFLGKKGDVLFWHARLMHRGSVPEVPLKPRRALICHYSGIHHRPDMPEYRRDSSDSGYYFVLGDENRVATTVDEPRRSRPNPVRRLAGRAKRLLTRPLTR